MRITCAHLPCSAFSRSAAEGAVSAGGSSHCTTLCIVSRHNFLAGSAHLSSLVRRHIAIASCAPVISTCFRVVMDGLTSAFPECQESLFRL